MATQTYHENLKHYSCNRCKESGFIAHWSIGDGPEDSPCPWCMQNLAELALTVLKDIVDNNGQARAEIGEENLKVICEDLCKRFEQTRSQIPRPPYNYDRLGCEDKDV